MKILLGIGALVLTTIAVLRVLKNSVPWHAESTERAVKGEGPVPIERAGCLHDLVSIVILLLGLILGWVAISL